MAAAALVAAIVRVLQLNVTYACRHGPDLLVLMLHALPTTLAVGSIG